MTYSRRVVGAVWFVLFGLPIVAGAQSTIFWVDEDLRTISRGALDGSGSPTTLYAIPDGLLFPDGIAVDSGSGAIYWADGLGSRICVGDVFGVGAPITLFDISDGVDAPLAIAIDIARGKVFWSEWGIILGSGQSIKVGNIDGTGSPATLYDSGSSPMGLVRDIALDVFHNDMYWTDWSLDRIVVGKIDGSRSPTTLYRATDLVQSPYGIDLDIGSGKIYWSEPSTIVVGNMDGSGSPATLFSGMISAGPWDVALDLTKRKVCWAINGQILAGNMDGSESPTVLFDTGDGVSLPSYLAIDAPQPLSAASVGTLILNGVLLAFAAVPSIIVTTGSLFGARPRRRRAVPVRD